MTNLPPTDPSIPSESVDYDRIDPRVLVVGAGAAGARTAIELVDQGVDPDDVLVIGKRGHGDAHTTWARGGINGALGTRDPEDDEIGERFMERYSPSPAGKVFGHRPTSYNTR